MSALFAQGNIEVGSLHDDARNSGVADNRPQFQGGTQALFEFIQSHMIYPDSALESNIQGMCVVKFLVKADGTLASFSIMKDIGGGCGDEALRIIASMPNWIPAYRSAMPVDSTMFLPVRFKIEDAPPSFPGGFKALQNFISAMIIVPQDIKSKGLQGKVELALYISADGEISHTETLYNSLELPSAEKAAKDVIALMPKWIPKIEGNRKIATKTFITFQF